MCQFETIVWADVPRVECGEHGVLQIDASWTDPGGDFTVLPELSK